MKGLRLLSQRWGPTIAILAVLGAPLWRMSLFVWSGERRLARVEVDTASIKRGQHDQCLVNFAVLSWMTAEERRAGRPDPPDPLGLLRDGCRELPYSQASGPAPDPGWMDAFAAEMPPSP